MFGCNSNFIETKDFALACVAKRDAITFTIILFQGCEYPSLPHHLICAFTIKHTTCITGGVSLQNKLGLYFRCPCLVGSSQVSNKVVGHPNTSL
jgi:hypothetical protein